MLPELTSVLVGKRVFITGHTGFKGAWLSLLLRRLGSEVLGYSLDPPSDPSLFVLAGVGDDAPWIRGDIRDADTVRRVMAGFDPDIVIHMAAQSQVRPSYANPLETLGINVMGTAAVLQACRGLPRLRAIVSVTSDKCYHNQGWVHGYRESDPLGGRDPYSASKGCAEIVTASFAASFFDQAADGPLVATVRSGNVIGGGDFATQRLVPDLMRAFAGGEPAVIRHPEAVRPWLHVLDSLRGYLLLAARLWEGVADDAGPWNFGPAEDSTMTVGQVADRLAAVWGADAAWVHRPDPDAQRLREAHLLRLEASKARLVLGWRPLLPLGEGLEWTARWYRTWKSRPADLREETLAQIDTFGARW